MKELYPSGMACKGIFQDFQKVQERSDRIKSCYNTVSENQEVESSKAWETIPLSMHAKYGL